MNLLLEKKIWGTFTKFCEKNVLCEKGDEITRFDGTKGTNWVDFFPLLHT